MAKPDVPAPPAGTGDEQEERHRITLSQAGMVRHWHGERKPGWMRRAAINGLGAVHRAYLRIGAVLGIGQLPPLPHREQPMVVVPVTWSAS